MAKAMKSGGDLLLIVLSALKMTFSRFREAGEINSLRLIQVFHSPHLQCRQYVLKYLLAEVRFRVADT